MTDELQPDDGPAYAPAVEEILHSAGIQVQKIEVGPGVEMTLLRFHTPLKVYTVKLDDGGVDLLVNTLRGTSGSPSILIARPGDVPNLRP